MNRLRIVLLYLAAGAVATMAASATSLLVHGVTAKRITWVAVGVATAVAIGICIAVRRPSQAPMPDQVPRGDAADE